MNIKKFRLNILMVSTLMGLLALQGCGGNNGLPTSSVNTTPSSSASVSSQAPQPSSSSQAVQSSAQASSSSIANNTGYQPGEFILGMDISYWSEQLDRGATYIDTDGQTKDLLALFKNHGINYIRLRTFVDPYARYGYASGDGGCARKAKAYNGKEDIIRMAQRIKSAGMGFLLDFHYSDTWADPGKQVIPESFRSARNIDEMAVMVKNYTVDVLEGLRDVNALPDMVQVGNETTPGMLIHVPTNNTDCWGNNGTVNNINGRANNSNWGNLGKLLKAGIEGVNQVAPDALTMLHVENTDHPDGVEWWVNSALNNGVHFDVLGLSAYEEFQGPASAWPGTFQRLANSFPQLSFAVVEFNPRGRLLADSLRNLPNDRGLGTFFWEPTESGFWGNAIFSRQGNAYRANASDFAVYDRIVEDYGLRKLP